MHPDEVENCKQEKKKIQKLTTHETKNSIDHSSSLRLFNEGGAGTNPITRKEQQTETGQPTQTRSQEGSEISAIRWPKKS